MEPKQIGQNILSIECAVGRGSVAVLRDGKVLASTGTRDESPSRAEQVLPVVRRVLQDAGAALSDIDAIAVSTGPGSYSGIRIGLSTAIGLGNALSIQPLGVSVLDAIALCEGGHAAHIVAAVAVGKRHAAWQAFDVSGDVPRSLSQPTLNTDDDFLSNLGTAGVETVLCCDDLISRHTGKLPDDITLTALRKPIAESIGVFAVRYPEKTSLHPLYLRDQAVGAG
jgi:tRNA threonylcarbamoyl adenosine modification protein YeaZ